MASTRIPAALAALIQETWPDGMIEEFDTGESDFPGIQAKLERDLGKIRGASLNWQTEPDEPVDWDDDSGDEPPLDREFQSYHIFFLVPDGDEFRYLAEGETVEPPEDPGQEEWSGVTVQGEGFFGCSAAVCLAAPVAIVGFADRSQYEDGTSTSPDIDECIVSGDPSENITPEAYYRSQLGPEAFQKLESLRARIVEVLQRHRLDILDESVLELPVPGLKAGEEVFMEEPIRVRDAFFFRGV
jgi:hypothetical protein